MVYTTLGVVGCTIINRKPVLIYDLAKEHLVEELKYPPSLMEMEYDPDFAIMVSSRGDAVQSVNKRGRALPSLRFVLFAYVARRRVSCCVWASRGRGLPAHKRRDWCARVG